MKNKIITILALLLMIGPISSFGQQVYFVENQAANLQKSNIDGTSLTSLLTSTLGLYGIATDITNSKIFYTNVVTDEIWTSGLDGITPAPAVLLNNPTNGIDGPRGIAIDGTNNKIYWAESVSGKIKRANLDGTTIEDVVTGLSSPVDVALDLVNNKLYWSDNGTGQKKITQSNLDGTSPVDVVTGLDQVSGIDVDAEGGKLYWVDFGASDIISRSNLDGTSPENWPAVLGGRGGSPRGLAVDKDNDKVFWSDVLNNVVNRSNRNGTSASTIITPLPAALDHPLGISTNWTNALPVELTTFSASVAENNVKLVWETATEINNYGFEVEKQNSEDRIQNSEWEKIGFVEGYGNSNSPKMYSFTDQVFNNNGFTFYRLKQIDIDGSYEYSDVVEVASILPQNYELLQNYPNPFNPTTTIQFELPTDSKVILSVFNVLGEKVATLIDGNISAGYHNIEFNARDINSGIYFYKLESKNFTQIRKMMLVK